MKITALHINLLLHYHCIAGPYHHPSRAATKYTAELEQHGLLRVSDHPQRVYETTDLGEAWFETIKGINPFQPQKREGLKDHQVAQLVNSVRDHLQNHCVILKSYGPLRCLIATAVMNYLLKEGLAQDHLGVEK